MIDQFYETLDRLARQFIRSLPARAENEALSPDALAEPLLLADPPSNLVWGQPDAAAVSDRDVWLIHPWNLGDLPTFLLANTMVVRVFISDFHRAWPWSEKRWRFVVSRMADLAALRWQGDTATLGAVLHSAAQVRSLNELHLEQWLPRLSICEAEIKIFPAAPWRCDSFNQWWIRTSRGIASASDLLNTRQTPAW